MPAEFSRKLLFRIIVVPLIFQRAPPPVCERFETNPLLLIVSRKVGFCVAIAPPVCARLLMNRELLIVACPAFRTSIAPPSPRGHQPSVSVKLLTVSLPPSTLKMRKRLLPLIVCPLPFNRDVAGDGGQP